MEEKKKLNVSLGTVVCIVIILINNSNDGDVHLLQQELWK